jgi:hypothetical protein
MIKKEKIKLKILKMVMAKLGISYVSKITSLKTELHFVKINSKMIMRHQMIVWKIFVMFAVIMNLEKEHPLY